MTKLDATKPLDDRFIDRIVDGEMTPSELRTAIDLLDGEPDGWKRCALAFLEDRCWRESLRASEEPAMSLLAGQSLSLPPVARTSTGRRWIRGPIAAAILAASFAMGWASHATRPWAGAEQRMTSQSDTGPTARGNGSRSEVDEGISAGLPRPTRLAAWEGGATRSVPAANSVVRPVGRLRLGIGGTGAAVPILAGPGINDQWLRNQPPPVTEHGQVALQRQGYQVAQRRQLITTTLPDGRRVTLPFDQVQIRYTGNNPL
jgi:hypothetical protein